MLLDKYKGKNVKILVSSNSGAGAGTTGNASDVMGCSVIVCNGVLSDYDDNYIETSNVKILRLNTWYESSLFSGNQPTRVDEYNQTLISQKSIISISVVEE